MSFMRLTVAILLVVFASKTCGLALAQNAEQQAGVRQADLPQYYMYLSDTQDENVNSVRPDDGLSRAAGITAPNRDPTDSSSDQQQLPATQISKSQDDDRGACCRPDCNNPCPCFYGDVEALFLQRQPQTIRQPIVVDANTNTTFLSTSNLNFDFDPGLQATFGMRLCGGLALEFSYFGLFQGTASAVVMQPNPNAFLIFPGNLFGNVFVDMDRAQVNYSSSLNSFALNLPHCCGCCDECTDQCGCPTVRCQSFEWFTGFRYLNLGDEFNIAAQRTVSGAVENGNYNINTANQLFGAQFGVRVRRFWGKFGWETTESAGIYGNAARETQSVIDFPNFPIRPTVSDSGGRVAYVGEINLSALYRLTDVWNLKAGYNLFWIEGVALGPDQLDFNFAASPSGNQLNAGGGMFLQGVNVGLEARW